MTDPRPRTGRHSFQPAHKARQVLQVRPVRLDLQAHKVRQVPVALALQVRKGLLDLQAHKARLARAAQALKAQRAPQGLRELKALLAQVAAPVLLDPQDRPEPKAAQDLQALTVKLLSAFRWVSSRPWRQTSHRSRW